MRKTSIVVAIVMLFALLLTACASSKEPEMVEDVTIRLRGLQGPTSMGLAQLVTDAQEGEESFKVDFEVVASPEEIVPLIVKGECDIAALPANLAATLYNRTEGEIVVLAVNTLGVLDIVERGDTVETIDDLKGRKLYASGEGAVPEYVIRLLLERKGLDPDNDVEIEWLSEHSAIVAKLETENDAVALLPQPFVTIAQKQLTDLRLAIDLNDDWSELIPEAGLVMGVLIAQKAFVEENTNTIDAFLASYEESINFTNENPKEASQMIEALDVFNAAVAEAAIPYCNIHYADGDPMKDSLSGFLELLHGMNPQSVGGKLPPADFYYGAK
ncbi:MAG TPA: ABC transporter substrate-binding protein [Clostridiaceae bacterium]|nr:ABC transporter substrate-binding protein [Clostridiaceae bacterium]